MKREDSRPSLRKLARAANVSPSTVSRALGGKEGVSEKTRARLMEMAEAMGLAPAGGAGGEMRRQATREPSDSRIQRITATLIVDTRSNPGLVELAAEPFYMELVAGLYEGGRVYHADLQLVRVDDDEGMADAIRRSADGVIWLGYNRIEGYLPWVPHFVSRGIPVVLCDHFVPGLPCDAALSDNVGGAYEAAQFIAQLGHSRVSILRQALTSTAAVERIHGSFAGLVQAGVLPSDIQVIEAPPSFDGGYTALDSVLDFGATAVLCGNDTMALGVIRRAVERGVAVPGELSVVGFDDISTSAKVTPALTTVHVDKRMLGMETVRRLRLCIIERELGIRSSPGVAGAAVRLLVPTRLICRESTGAAALRPATPPLNPQSRST